MVTFARLLFPARRFWNLIRDIVLYFIVFQFTITQLLLSTNDQVFQYNNDPVCARDSVSPSRGVPLANHNLGLGNNVVDQNMDMSYGNRGLVSVSRAITW